MPIFSRRRTLLVLAALTTVAAAVPAGQAGQASRDTSQPAAAAVGTGEIAGTVSIAGTGQPARRARVNLGAADGGGSRSAVTDNDGRFSFGRLLPGRYSLSASKPGHVNGSFGQSRPGRPGTAIQLGEGEKFEARLQITRGGVITGTVLDEHGDAIPGTQVRVLRYVMQAGTRTLQPSGNGATDDRGIYRIFGLQPGDYVLAATPRNSDNPQAVAARVRQELLTLRERLAAGGELDDVQRRELAMRASMLESGVSEVDEPATGYAPVYYPGTTAVAQAAAIAIGPGEERGGIDLQLQRVPVATVEGLVINPTNQPVQNVQLTLVAAGQPMPAMTSLSTRADADGRFRFASVAPGQYTLLARGAIEGGAGRGRGEMPGRGGPFGRGAQQTPDRLWGALDVAVDGRNVSNLTVTLQNGLTISGRIVFDGAKAAPTDLTRIRVNAAPADPGSAREVGGAANGRVDAAGKFTIGGVIPGRYRITASGAGSGWFVESSVLDGIDTLDFPADVKPGQSLTSAVITFTDRQSSVAGTVTDEQGRPAPGYTVILFPADERYWLPQSRRIRTARPATDGTFTFAGIPPGEYRIVPLADVEPGSWSDPTFLQQLDAAGGRVQVADGEKKLHNLRVSGGG